MNYSVYYLFYDDSLLLGYIGATICNPIVRAGAHISEAFIQNKSDKHKWITSHSRDDLKLRIIEEGQLPNQDSIDVREQFWIDYLRWGGITLHNILPASTWPNYYSGDPIIHYTNRYKELTLLKEFRLANNIVDHSPNITCG